MAGVLYVKHEQTIKLGQSPVARGPRSRYRNAMPPAKRFPVYRMLRISEATEAAILAYAASRKIEAADAAREIVEAGLSVLKPKAEARPQ